MLSERNAFRAAVALAGLVPVCAGLLGAIGGEGVFADAAAPVDVSLDSHVRYLSGLLLGIGLVFWATLGRPEAHTACYRVMTAIVFLGGLARLGGLAAAGEPDPPMRLALIMELLVTPAICLWQARIARLARQAPPPR
jgi:hypothetical protein